MGKKEPETEMKTSNPKATLFLFLVSSHLTVQYSTHHTGMESCTNSYQISEHHIHNFNFPNNHKQRGDGRKRQRGKKCNIRSTREFSLSIKYILYEHQYIVFLLQVHTCLCVVFIHRAHCTLNVLTRCSRRS